MKYIRKQTPQNLSIRKTDCCKFQLTGVLGVDKVQQEQRNRNSKPYTSQIMPSSASVFVRPVCHLSSYTTE